MSALERDGRLAGAKPKRIMPKLLVGLAVAVGALLLVLANTHLVYVAVTSQPECVAHPKGGGGVSEAGSFSAAKPAC